MYNSKPLLLKSEFPALRRAQLTTLQMNLGYLCNLSCVHCHVNAGPKRTELMTREVMANALKFAEKQSIQILDLTGGSPEMNPDFRWLVETARRQGLHVIDRCNPTILVEPGYEWAAEFLAEQQVEIIASLPCYIGDNVDAQRGKGVFSSSIAALKRLNELGYGRPDSGLELNLVFNPQGPVLPPPQQALEQQYRDHLGSEFGIVFNRLLAITNMPIQRFGAVLMAGGKHETDSRQVFDDYLRLLKDAYRPENLSKVMCKSLLSIDWQGFVYDCDFNQMLDLPLGGKNPVHIGDLLSEDLGSAPIQVADHCFGCTAGQGSSCGGAL
ncbi:MAG: arsenosugar biosynthesis radical SAM protein ArsS [Gammaproteobacteria bacterium]|uniref:arsenosugar biosynthesis radical SAM (seleno)protein ArsS n=1 Tax=Methylotuvimicrobium sp. TaxID=2822413 RepID=UPI001D91AC7B|nr:arsenosugar biosynthesis radical SAM protein ArsS [Gammaproteobacteria bacterium]